MFTLVKTAVRGVPQLVQKLWLGSDIRFLPHVSKKVRNRPSARTEYLELVR